MIMYEKGEFVWAKNYVKSPKQKIQSRYLIEPLEVVKDFGYALLAKNHLGVVLKLHKNNVKRYYPRDLELYNTLPLRLKIKLGSKFDQKDLHKFYDELQKEEGELSELHSVDATPEVQPTSVNRGQVPDDEKDDIADSDSESESVILDTSNQPESDELPFHMKLRKRKVQFT